MCNQVLQNEFQKIPEQGTGWKLFKKTGEELKQLVLEDPYQKDPDGWISWMQEDSGDGFCFFLTEEEVRKSKQLIWLARKTIVIREIEYDQGLGSFIQLSDQSWPSGARFAICKKFKVKGGLVK